MRGAAAACAVVAVAAVLLAAPAAVGAAGAASKIEPCFACHGAQGRSETAGVPSLGAQPSDYTTTQLFLFREGLRAAEPMNAMAKELTDDDLRSMSAIIAGLPPPTAPAGPGEAARIERGRALAAQYHCNVCHRPDFSGQGGVPRLADQREDYLLKSLRDFKSGARHGYDATMAEALQPVADAQLPDLAYYLARIR